jgi:hypothetical protein
VSEAPVTSGKSNAQALVELAAPEDGRTPLKRFFIFLNRSRLAGKVPESTMRLSFFHAEMSI